MKKKGKATCPSFRINVTKVSQATALTTRSLRCPGNGRYARNAVIERVRGTSHRGPGTWWHTPSPHEETCRAQRRRYTHSRPNRTTDSQRPPSVHRAARWSITSPHLASPQTMVDPPPRNKGDRQGHQLGKGGHAEDVGPRWDIPQLPTGGERPLGWLDG